MFSIIKTSEIIRLRNENEEFKYNMDFYKKFYHRTLDNNSKNKKEEKIMTDKFEFSNFTYGNIDGQNWFEIVRVSDGRFLKCKGFKTEEDALTKAREIAIHYPSDTFYIIAPVKVVRADIPVITEDYVNGPL